MVHNVPLYINSLPLDAPSKGILQAIAAIKLQGNQATPGYREMAMWAVKSRRTVARALRCLEDKGYLKRKRRGKKLTNAYYLGHFLYRLLTAGRRILKRHEERKAESPPDPARVREWFKELYGAVSKGRSRPPG